MPLGGVDSFLRSEMNQESTDGANKRRLRSVDVSESKGPPLKSVDFQLGSEIGGVSSARCGLIGLSDAGQFLASGYRPDDAVYNTSEMKSIARQWAKEPIETKVYHAEDEGFNFLVKLRPNKERVRDAQNFIQATLQELF